MFMSITILSMVFSVNTEAIQAPNMGNVVETKVEVDGTVSTVRELTEEEYIIRLSEVSGISLEDAEIKVNKTKANLSDENRGLSIVILGLPPHHHYMQYIVTNDFGGGYLVEAGALAVVYSHGSFRAIASINQVWTAATGSGTYTWHESYKEAVHNGISITVKARGNIVVEVDTSVEGGVEIGSDLVGFGFNLSGSTSTTNYYRKTEDWSKTWNLY